MSRTRLDLSGLDDMRFRLDGAIKSALVSTAIIIRDDAKVLAPKDTTALMESIHVASFDWSDWKEAIDAAEAKFNAARDEGKTPKGRRIGPNQSLQTFPEIHPPSNNEVWVVVGVVYGNDVENSIRAPQMFLTPATYNNRATLTDQIRLAINGLSVKAKFTRYSEL